ncbi:hypothetical protein CEXT_517521 [Caerostris extrusa]|uniref:Uncharacterized protein n=1 Tax=Caerostris extrusa TaxID=172846 RepID=A0AAV4U6J6_CAEEX|nr:hypothetical protein CEXT_517521 [Caerostris extrusa]
MSRVPDTRANYRYYLCFLSTGLLFSSRHHRTVKTSKRDNRRLILLCSKMELLKVKEPSLFRPSKKEETSNLHQEVSKPPTAIKLKLANAERVSRRSQQRYKPADRDTAARGEGEEKSPSCVCLADSTAIYSFRY